MKKTLTIMLAVLLMICMVPAFNAFAANEDFQTIDTPEEFDAFTKAVNAGTYTPSGVVTITADLDMRNITDFQPINNLTGFDLDFQNHTIYNLVVTTTGNGVKVNEYDAAIIAHRISGAWIENLYLYNCKLIASNVNRAAMVAGDFNNGGFNNIHVENCTLQVEHNLEANGQYACGAIVAYNYGVIGTNVTVKNVRLESETAKVFSSVIGCLYGSSAAIYVDSINVENVTSKQGNEEKAVDKILGLGKADVSYLVDLTIAEGTVSVSNTATATGYSETHVNKEQLPEKPVEPPVTTTVAPTTTKTPNTTKAPETTKAPTNEPVDDKDKGGCKGFAAGSVAIVALLTVAGSALLLKKKKD